MTLVVELFWRSVTAADFFNIERKREYAPPSGGGQTYISVSFRGVTHAELGEFLGVEPPARIQTDRPERVLTDVAVASDPATVADLTFRARYRPPQPDDRYYIAQQNRQYPNQARHPAWTSRFGFPRADDDVSSPSDPRMPDLEFLKIWVAKLEDGSYAAGYFNSGTRPPALESVADAAPLFEPYDARYSAGVIDLRGTDISLSDLTSSRSPDVQLVDKSPELVEALDATRGAAGRRPSGQGLRASAAERQAIEKRAVDLATAKLRADGWSVEDVGLYRPYDLDCVRGDQKKRVEVKGTTGDGTTVLLTPNEVTHAREHVNVALMIVSGIMITVDEAGVVVGSGGTLRVVDPWQIDSHGSLTPTGYGYHLA